MPVQIGGTARDYQRVFAALTAQQSGLWPNGAVSPAVYLYITALGPNVLNCRMSSAFDQSLLACQLRHAGAQAVDVSVGHPEGEPGPGAI
jgi:hypothetical protein